jgi:hypothetical protein
MFLISVGLTILVSVSGVQAQPKNYSLSDVRFVLEYEPAWGQSRYQITIQGVGDGTFVETGSDSVYFVVPKDKIWEMLDVLYEQHYFEYRDVYGTRDKVTISSKGQVTVSGYMLIDVPTVVTTVQIGAYKKVVRDCWFAPPALHRFQRLMVEASGVDADLGRS